MKSPHEITLRQVEAGDLENLKAFFVRAYGVKSIFQHENFLKHYFGAGLNGQAVFGYSLIGVDKDGTIVSHYGGLGYGLRMRQEIKSMVWGVSAYTLPEFRGMGLNSGILDCITENFEINGVIGFSDSTSLFYKRLRYNVFDFEKLTRHVLVLDAEKTAAVSAFIGQDDNRLHSKNPDLSELLKNKLKHQVIELTAENIDGFELNLDKEFPELTTTHRSTAFLKWRFLEHPFIKYTLYGVLDGNEILAYAALREETLHPVGFQVNRIIDLYGETDVVRDLLEKTVEVSVEKNCIYIDFSKFGLLYEKELNSFGFIHLENDECCILPQVTSPIENRPNGEFLGIFSQSLPEEIKALRKENVYFTRMDSDRDRLANIDQIKQYQI